MNGSVDIIKIWQPKLLSDMVLQIKKKKLWTDSELKDQIIAHKDQHHSALALCSPIPGCCCALQVYNQIIRLTYTWLLLCPQGLQPNHSAKDTVGVCQLR